MTHFQKLYRKSSLGAKVHEIFSSNFELKDFELIKTYKDKLIILKSLSSDFNIYGSILISENNQYALFLTSLQLIDLDTLDNFNLSINDFPLSDTTVDHMISLQTAKSAAAENKALVKSLQKERKGFLPLETNSSIFSTRLTWRFWKSALKKLEVTHGSLL